MDGPEAIRAWARSGGVGSYRQGDTGAMPAVLRVAWAGRTSTYDQQDPTLSLPRQLRASRDVLPEHAVIVAHFYDVESGRKDLADRGQGHAHELFQIPIPRDGGIADLLEEARRRDRRFDVVICESIDRIARRTYIATEIEHQLEQAGVRLLAADEPIILPVGGRRAKSATQVLTRRVKQGVAEWYVLELLEKSWGGFEVHTEAGFNIGKPCYGYRARRIPHPVPAKRARGVKKTRLDAHLAEAAVVRKVFTWRVTEHLGYQAIADRLNLDLTENPPPIPVEPDRAAGRWTYSNVREILTNPKYTGHMVWNRHARKGSGRNRLNPPDQWVWSPEPVHEALVDLETFVQAQMVAGRRERTRTAAGVGRHPRARRVYRLRGYLYHAQCGRRMYGKGRHGTSYYACVPKPGYRPPGHTGPASLWLREDILLDGLSGFLSQRIFGTGRQYLLDASLKAMDTARQRERQQQRAALARAIADNKTRSRNLIRSLEAAEEPDQELIRDVNERRAELRAERARLEAELAGLDEELAQAPNPALLDQLPVSTVDLSELPDDISRRLFEALRLEISFDHEHEQVTFTITLTGDTIDVVRQVAEAAVLPFRRQGTGDMPNGQPAGESGPAASQSAGSDLFPSASRPQ
jgi:site-specific DNA recombinase